MMYDTYKDLLKDVKRCKKAKNSDNATHFFCRGVDAEHKQWMLNHGYIKSLDSFNDSEWNGTLYTPNQNGYIHALERVPYIEKKK